MMFSGERRSNAAVCASCRTEIRYETIDLAGCHVFYRESSQERESIRASNLHGTMTRAHLLEMEVARPELAACRAALKAPTPPQPEVGRGFSDSFDGPRRVLVPTASKAALSSFNIWSARRACRSCAPPETAGFMMTRPRSTNLFARPRHACRSRITVAATAQLSPLQDCAILQATLTSRIEQFMPHIDGSASTTLACRLPPPRIGVDSFSIIITGTSGGSVQHRLSAVHEHNG